MQPDIFFSLLIVLSAAKFSAAAQVPDFRLDTARLLIASLLQSERLAVQLQNVECNRCPLLDWTVDGMRQIIPAGGNETLLIQSKYASRLRIYDADSQNITYCSSEQSFRHFGEYSIEITADLGGSCSFVLNNNPENIYLPLLWVALVFLGLFILYLLLQQARRKKLFAKVLQRFGKENKDEIDMDAAVQEKTASVGQRLRSLDTFRGLCLVVMIFVNYGGGGYWIFEHPPWNGLTIADLVFPWFVFIMGTSMTFSFRGMLRRRTSRPRILLHVLRRTILLFVIGVCLLTRSKQEWSTMRIPGVLQRLALSYFLVAGLHVYFATTDDEYKYTKYHSFRDILDFPLEWPIVLSYVALHTGLVYGLKAPGCTRGYVGPGGLDDGGVHVNCTGGVTGYVDRLIFTERHIYPTATFVDVYHSTQSFDPEGLLGTLTSAFMCYLGMQCGRILVYFDSMKERLIRWTIWGFILGMLGATLCLFSKDEGWIPVNKNIWSLSFSLCLSGLAFWTVAIFFLVIDYWKIWDGRPFYYPGMNSLVIYICHSCFAIYIPVQWSVNNTQHCQLLSMAIWGSAFWTFVAWRLFENNIFINL